MRTVAYLKKVGITEKGVEITLTGVKATGADLGGLQRLMGQDVDLQIKEVPITQLQIDIDEEMIRPEITD